MEGQIRRSIPRCHAFDISNDVPVFFGDSVVAEVAGRRT